MVSLIVIIMQKILEFSTSVETAEGKVLKQAGVYNHINHSS